MDGPCLQDLTEGRYMQGHVGQRKGTRMRKKHSFSLSYTNLSYADTLSLPFSFSHPRTTFKSLRGNQTRTTQRESVNCDCYTWSV